MTKHATRTARSVDPAKADVVFRDPPDRAPLRLHLTRSTDKFIEPLMAIVSQFHCKWRLFRPAWRRNSAIFGARRLNTVWM